MFLFRDGLLTLMCIDSFISLMRLWSSLPTILKLSSEVDNFSTIPSTTLAITSAILKTVHPVWLFHLPQWQQHLPSHCVAIPSATMAINISHPSMWPSICHIGKNICQPSIKGFNTLKWFSICHT